MITETNMSQKGHTQLAFCQLISILPFLITIKGNDNEK